MGEWLAARCRSAHCFCRAHRRSRPRLRLIRRRGSDPVAPRSSRPRPPVRRAGRRRTALASTSVFACISIRPTGGQPEGAKLLTITTREPIVTAANGVVERHLPPARLADLDAARRSVGAALRDAEAGRQPRASGEAASAVAANPIQRRARVLALPHLPGAVASREPGAMPVVRPRVHRRGPQVPGGRQGRIPDPARRADQPHARRRGAHRA